MELDNITAIIIDDEPDAINLLVIYLHQYPSIIILGTSTKAIEGLKLVERNRPNLIFLDIEPDIQNIAIFHNVILPFNEKLTGITTGMFSVLSDESLVFH